MLIVRHLDSYWTSICQENFECYYLYNIYVLVEDNGEMKWNYLTKFDWRQSMTNFPKIIAPMNNEKFILYSQWNRISEREFFANYTLSYIMEFWDIDQNFNRSHIVQNELLGFLVTNNLEKLWIFQL